MVNYLQPTTLKLWQKNCEIICGSKTTPGLDLPHHKSTREGVTNSVNFLVLIDFSFYQSLRIHQLVFKNENCFFLDYLNQNLGFSSQKTIYPYIPQLIFTIMILALGL